MSYATQSNNDRKNQWRQNLTMTSSNRPRLYFFGGEDAKL